MVIEMNGPFFRSFARMNSIPSRCKFTKVRTSSNTQGGPYHIMGEEVAEWSVMWGAKVKMPNDMPDDILKDAITFTREQLERCNDFESDGLAVAEKIKKHFDDVWTPYWHVVIGRNFGSFVNHETKRYVYFYLQDKAVMIYKAG